MTGARPLFQTKPQAEFSEKPRSSQGILSRSLTFCCWMFMFQNATLLPTLCMLVYDPLWSIGHLNKLNKWSFGSAVTCKCDANLLWLFSNDVFFKSEFLRNLVEQAAFWSFAHLDPFSAQSTRPESCCKNWNNTPTASWRKRRRDEVTKRCGLIQEIPKKSQESYGAKMKTPDTSRHPTLLRFVDFHPRRFYRFTSVSVGGR